VRCELLTFLCRYRKGFELQSTLYSGINLAVLLLVAGQRFESSMELRKIGKYPHTVPQTSFLPLSLWRKQNAYSDELHRQKGGSGFLVDGSWMAV